MNDVLAILNRLPEIVFTVNIANPTQVIAIKRGEMGFYPARNHDTAENAQTHADRLNSHMLVPPTAAQIMAMEYGSCFGWEIPLADPDVCAKELGQ